MVKEFLVLGQIVGTHGVRGEMRVNPWCDSPDFAKKFKTLYMDEGGAQPVRVLSCRPHGNVFLVKLEGIDSIAEAEKHRDRMLYIKRSDAMLPENTWFIEELIGCSVLDADTARCYGTLSDVMSTGANDVWAVTDEKGHEYLLPAIKDVVIAANVSENKVFIRPLKGIFDDAD